MYNWFGLKLVLIKWVKKELIKRTLEVVFGRCNVVYRC